MKYVPSFLVFVIFLFTSPSFAAVIAVDIYPEGAAVTEQVDAIVAPNSDNRAILLYVPVHVQKSNLNVAVAGATVLSLSTRELDVFEPDPRREQLKSKLDNAKEALAVIEEELQTLEARKAYWLYLGKDTAEVTKMRQIDAALEQNLTDILAHIRVLHQSKAEQTAKIAVLTKAYEAPGQTMEVRASLDRPVSGEHVQAQCSYYTNQAYWQARYHFDALPQQGNVRMRVSAEIVQHSGFAWDNAEINLLTLNPSGSILPPAVRPWIVRESIARLSSSRVVATNVSAAMAEDAATPMQGSDSVVAPKARQHESKGTYAIWKIGKRVVESGTPVSVLLAENELKSVFYDIVRPGLTSTAFLMALVDLPDDQQMISGQATFFIEGALAGESFFDPGKTAEPEPGQSGVVASADQSSATAITESGRTGLLQSKLFFGPDRQVTCRYVELARMNDQHGLLSKVQSRLWHWRVDVTNNRTVPVRVRVEDAVPQIQDKRITLEFKAQPEPRRTDSNLYVWDAELKSKEMFTITCKASISAPEELKISSTR